MKTIKALTTEVKPNSILVQFLADVEFGVMSKNCQNFGICRIHKKGQKNQTSSCSKSQATALVTLFDKGIVRLDFLRSTLKPRVYERYFVSGTFKIEEDYICHCSPETSNRFSIKKGTYPIAEKETLISVLFK